MTVLQVMIAKRSLESWSNSARKRFQEGVPGGMSY
jgi:hypothetical protein